MRFYSFRLRQKLFQMQIFVDWWTEFFKQKNNEKYKRHVIFSEKSRKFGKQMLIQSPLWLSEADKYNAKNVLCVYILYIFVFQQIFIFYATLWQSVLLTMQKLHSYSYLDFNPYLSCYCPAAVVWFKYLYTCLHDSANVSVYLLTIKTVKKTTDRPQLWENWNGTSNCNHLRWISCSIVLIFY